MGLAGLYERSGDEFVVNTVTAGDQAEPRVAALASGGFVAVWLDGDQIVYTGRAMAQIYDATGAKVGGEIEVATASNPYLYPLVTALSGGGFAVTWYQSGTPAHNFTQIFDAAGAKVGGAVDTTVGTTPDLVMSSASLANDRFVLVGEGGSSGQIFDGSGNPVGSAFSLVDLNTSAGATVESLAGGGFVVAGQVYDYYGLNGRGIALQVFDANGTKLGSQIEFQTTYHGPGQIDIGRLANGGFVLTFTDSAFNAAYAQVFDATGTAVTGIFLAAMARGEVGEPEVTGTADGGFFLTWREGADGGAIASNIYGQFFTAAGVVAGDRFLISQLTDHPNRNHESPSSALLASGEIVTLWHGAGPGDPRAPGLPPADAGGGIRGQIIAPLDAAPTIEITPSTSTVNEAAIENLPALLLSAGSEAVNAHYTFTLLADSSGGAFAIEGDRLVLVDSERLDAETAPQVTVTVRATDQAGNAVDRAIALTIGEDALELRYTAGEETLVSVERTWVQSEQVVAALDTGGFVVVWTHGGWNGDGTGTAIYAQLYDDAKTAIGDAFLVNTYTSAGQETPSVTALDGGGFFVAWSSSGSSGFDVRGQRYESDGTRLGDEIFVETSNNYSVSPQVVARAGGGTVLVWTENTGFESDIHLQMLDAAGAPVGPVRVVNTTTAGWQTMPDVAVLGDGSLVVSWTDSSSPNNTGTIRAQRLDSAGNALGGEFLVNPASANGQSFSTVTAIDGGFVVTWANNFTIKAQVFDLAGQPAGGQIAVGPGGYDPFVAALPGGGFAIAWTSFTGSATGDRVGSSVMMQAYDASGAAVGSSQVLNDLTDGNQNDPSFAVLADGTLALVWTDQSRSYQLGDVKLRLFEPQQSMTYGTEGPDTLAAGQGGGSVYGKGGNDTLTGSTGNDRLDGGAGNDTMAGGLGDDLYVVDSAGDTVVELPGQGTDTIATGISYTLAAGSAVENLATSDAAATTAINLTGNAAANLITGNAGANVLNGRGGADTLVGLGGDDWYYVDNAADVVVELAGGGANDRVLAGVSYALGAGVHVERLTTDNNAGTAAINLTGNALANLIYGNAGANVLNGVGGADTLIGLGGDDWYLVDNALDNVTEGAGEGTADRVFASVSYTLGAGVQVERLTTNDNAGTSAINLTGNALANLIYGNAGSNVLDGSAGADGLVGLGGNDRYHVDNAADTVTEGAADGTLDWIYASVSYTLGAGVYAERLTTNNNGGTAAINLTGNALNNVIYGNAGSNVLNGMAGADLLAGLAGDDFYWVDNASDAVSETAGNGTDRVFASVSYTLTAGAHVERLTTDDNNGTAAITLTGNALANLIYGNAGANLLDGKEGNDGLIGLGGADRFAFTTALGADNVDTIDGFSVADDTIVLDDAVFAGLAAGALAAGAFNTGAAASQADDRIVYDSATGALSFDADGNGAGAAVQFATLAAGLALTSADFLVV